MPNNIPWPERVVRAFAGVCLLGLYGALPGPWRYLTLLGLFPLGTALTGNCPMYTLAARRGWTWISRGRGETR